MFSFFKGKKEKASHASQLIVHTDKVYEKKLPTISEERITLSVNELLDGKYTYAQVLLENFFYVNAKLQKTIARSLLEMLNSLSAKKWYAFSDLCRGYSCSNYLMPRNISQVDISRAKYPHLSDDEYAALLCVGTFHYNGYFREECLRKLADYNGHLCYFYIRMNDWVKEIRDASAELLNKLLPKCPLYDIIKDTPILEKLHFTRRRSEKHFGDILSIICGRIKNELNAEHISHLLGEEPYVRNSFYRFGCQNELFGKEILDFIIEHEPFGNSKERVLMHKLSRFDCSESDYEKYIRHKCPNVRYTALLKNYEELGSAWDGLEELLTDKSSKVRTLAAFILKKYKGFDAREYYRGLLGTENTLIALTDLGTYGTKADAEAVKSFISSDNTAIARKALHTYGKLMGAEGEDTYWEQLCSEDNRVSKEAYRIITENRIIYSPESLWNEYQRHVNQAHRARFVHLLCSQTDWERIKYLVKLYVDDSLDKILKEKVADSLCSQNVYKRLSAETADELISVINEHKYKLGKLAYGLLFDIEKARD
ncbi:HEAT repeat domain-containing protein [Ruminococcus flavefaciens]|uniref:HEAT repeat domain-containing protein n=1 Tax=Ruminococcus flavefaciens TaxID=1265 RepID=UPI00048DF048|nr:HEAT repeat domain-containing protein [Ruminococcus flavefaciens]